MLACLQEKTMLSSLASVGGNKSKKKHDDYDYIPPIGLHMPLLAASSSSTKRKHAISSHSKGGMRTSFFFLSGGGNGSDDEEEGNGLSGVGQLRPLPTAPPPPQSPTEDLPQPIGGGNRNVKPDDFEIAGITASSNKDGKKGMDDKSKKKKGWNITNRWIYILNSLAVVLHGGACIGILVMGNSKSKKIWHLKQDRIHASVSSASSTPFVHIKEESCSPAKPNYLTFSGNDNIPSPLVLWAYPQVTNYHCIFACFNAFELLT